MVSACGGIRSAADFLRPNRVPRVVTKVAMGACVQAPLNGTSYSKTGQLMSSLCYNGDTHLGSRIANSPLVPLVITPLKLLGTGQGNVSAEHLVRISKLSYDVYSPVFIISTVLDFTATAGMSLRLTGQSITPT